MPTPHKHADLIKAWADGSEIEVWVPGSGWELNKSPLWSNLIQYRIKPTPKPHIVTWHSVYPEDGFITACHLQKADLTAAVYLRVEIDYNDPTKPMLVSATLESS